MQHPGPYTPPGVGPSKVVGRSAWPTTTPFAAEASSVPHETVLAKAARVLLSMGGHLQGDYVLHAVLRDDPASASAVECTLPAALLPYAPGVLAASGLSVACVGRPPGSACCTRRLYRVSFAAGTGDGGGGVATIDLGPFFRSRAQADPHDTVFDWQTVSLSRDRLYVRRDPASAHLDGDDGPGIGSEDRPVPVVAGDRVVRLVERARRGVFCLSAGFCPGLRPPLPGEPAHAFDADDGTTALSPDAETFRTHARAMCVAARLVLERGWRMDDQQVGRRAWVVARRDSLGRARGDGCLGLGVRGSASACPGPSASASAATLPSAWPPAAADVPSPSPALMAVEVCPICHDRFHASDVIVNLPCNHNFHAVCHRDDPRGAGGGNGGGMCAWLQSGHGTCPCCRAAVIRNF